MVKLIVSEPETPALDAFLQETPHRLATSRIAVVEVSRAVGLTRPSRWARADAERLLDSCLLVEASPELLRAAARLASREIRTLDAIHLASAQQVGADAVLVYDRRLTDAARAAHFEVHTPS